MSTATLKSAPSLPSGFAAEDFEEFLQSRIEPEWVTQRRRAAFELFQAKSAEELDPEEWKRVPTRAFRPDRFSLTTGTAAGFDSTDLPLMQNRAEFGGAVVHVDGSMSESRLREEIAAKGVIFGDLATALREHSDLLEPYLSTKAVLPETDRFSAWHRTALPISVTRW